MHNLDAFRWVGGVVLAVGMALVPAKTPRDIINTLHAESAKSLKLPEVQERIAALGFGAVGNTPQEFAAFLKSELEKWARVAKAAGAKAE